MWQKLHRPDALRTSVGADLASLAAAESCRLNDEDNDTCVPLWADTSAKRSCVCGRNPFEVEHLKATAHLLSFIGAVVQTILLRATEAPIYGRYWTGSSSIYTAMFSVSRVRRHRLHSFS